MSDTAQSYPGERLGLPETGPGSVGRLGRRIAALFIDYAAATIIATAYLGFQQWALPKEAGLSQFAPMIVFAVLQIVFIPTIGDYITPNLIGGGKLPMIANMIEKQMLKADNKALGSAIAVSAMLVVGAVSLLFLFLNRRYLKGNK